jgi:hypothetical protein
MIEENKCIFFICKKNGYSNKTNNKQYDIGDNDFYWLNCENKKTFFVIPEKILIEKQLVGNIKNKLSLKVTIKDTLHPTSAWLQPYMFTYENIDKERLLHVLSIT